MPNEHSRSRQVFILCVVQVWVVFAFLVLPTLCPTDVFGLPASSSLSLLSLHVQVRLKQCHEGRDESFDTFILDEDKVQIACAVWAPLLSVKRRLASVFSFSSLARALCWLHFGPVRVSHKLCDAFKVQMRPQQHSLPTNNDTPCAGRPRHNPSVLVLCAAV